MTSENAGQYAIVELMGHKVVAGLVSKSEMLGKPMLRVDVPATSTYPEYTQFYGETAIYCVTFVSEEVARLTAEQSKVNPVSVYVPDLISKENHEKIITQYKQEIQRLSHGLPESVRSIGDQSDRFYDGDDDDGDSDMEHED